MKKVLSIVAVGAFIFSMTSCKKTYTCECKDAQGQIINSSVQMSKNKDAETWCEKNSTDGSSLGYTCELK